MSETAIITSGVISLLSGGLGAYVIANYMMKKAKNEILTIAPEVFEEIIADLPKYMSNTEVQKGFYQIGMLIGNGAKQGIGIAPSGKTEKGLMGLVQQFLPMIMGGMRQGQNPQQQQPQAEGGLDVR